MVFYYFMIGIMPLDQHPFWGQALFGTLTLIKILGIICCLAAFARLGSRGVNLQFPRDAQTRWFFAFLLVLGSSYFVQFGQLEFGLMAYSHVLSIAMLFMATLVLIDTPRRLYYSMLTAVGAAGFASLYTIRQQQKYGDLYGFRPGGLSGDANEYALVISLWLPLAFLYGFSKRPLWERALCLGSLGTMLLGTTYASSRGGFVGLVGGFLFLSWFSRNRVRNLLLASAMIIPLTLFSSTSVLNRFKNPNYGDQLAEQARLIVWKAGWRMIQAYPLTGVGLHNFRSHVVRYEEPGEGISSLAHNTYVEVGAELGIPGLIAFLGTLITTLFGLRKARLRLMSVGAVELANLALGLQAGLVSFAISAAFVSAWWEKLFWLSIFATIYLIKLARGLVVRQRAANSLTEPVQPDNQVGAAVLVGPAPGRS